MKKYYPLLLLISFVLTGCLHPFQPYTGRVQELPGAQVYYEPVVPASLQDFYLNGTQYSIITNPDGYQAQGTAGWFDDSLQDQTTLTGDRIDNFDYVGAHASLPLPSYVSVTNMNNGRRLLVRLIARPSQQSDGQIITLSKLAADRLMLTELTPIQIDYLPVNADGTVSGSLNQHVESTRQSYPLPARPDIAAE